MILHFSQRLLMDGLTFIANLSLTLSTKLYWQNALYSLGACAPTLFTAERSLQN